MPHASACCPVDDALKTELVVRIRLTPKSARDGVDGLSETADGLAIKVRVRAVPEKGAANQALLATVAKHLGIAKTRISLSAGSKSRVKLIRIVCTDTDDRQEMVDSIEKLPRV